MNVSVRFLCEGSAELMMKEKHRRSWSFLMLKNSSGNGLPSLKRIYPLKMGLLPQKGTACLPTVHLQGENVGFREDKDYGKDVDTSCQRGQDFDMTCITVSPLGASTYFAQISPLPRFSLSFTKWAKGLGHPKNHHSRLFRSDSRTVPSSQWHPQLQKWRW